MPPQSSFLTQVTHTHEFVVNEDAEVAEAGRRGDGVFTVMGASFGDFCGRVYLVSGMTGAKGNTFFFPGLLEGHSDANRQRSQRIERGYYDSAFTYTFSHSLTPCEPTKQYGCRKLTRQNVCCTEIW
jgi:hypothetical protein